jgi:hypothetical protein
MTLHNHNNSTRAGLARSGDRHSLQSVRRQEGTLFLVRHSFCNPVENLLDQDTDHSEPGGRWIQHVNPSSRMNGVPMIVLLMIDDVAGQPRKGRENDEVRCCEHDCRL